ncbi:GDP-L-fucose synthase family protein [Methylomagnum sp.]
MSRIIPQPSGMPWCRWLVSTLTIIMNKGMQGGARIFVAGHRGLVGSAIVRRLADIYGTSNHVITRTHDELDLTDQAATDAFFEAEKPDYVFLAAAKVGGIHANNTYPAEFIRDNLVIQSNIIHAAWRNHVSRLLFLGSSCIYPKLAPQPLKEECLLTGSLEPTNRPYALAKIAGIEMCWSYNRQYGTKFLAVMPTNLYGPGDNYHPENSHVIPALIRKFHEAKQRGEPDVVVWGSGTPLREFLYSEDMADACVHLMNLPDESFDSLLGSDESQTGRFEPPLVNIGVGEDVTIRELAEIIKDVIGCQGNLVFDPTKPDGTPRKLMDVSRLNGMGWKAKTTLRDGLATAYMDFQRNYA